jgi:tetratricopeptide (TPR) repeat protein
MKTHRLLPWGLALLPFLAVACSGAAETIKRGDQLASAGLHEEALAEYEKAGRASPEDAELAVKIAQSRRQLAAQLGETARKQAEAGDRRGALGTLKRALEHDPDGRALETEMKRLVTAELEAGRKAADEARWQDALDQYGWLQKEFPRLAPARVGRERVVEAWAGGLLKEARDFLGRGLEANALISVLKAQRVAGGPVGNSAALESELRGRLKQASLYAFAVLPGKPKARFVEGTARLVGLVERAEVPGCPGAVAGAAGQARLRLTLELIGLEFSQARAESRASQRYQSGTRPVPNPAFGELEQTIEQGRGAALELEKKIKEVERVVEQARRAFEDAGPSDDEDSLRGKLKAAERELEVLRKNLADTQSKVLAQRNQLSATPRMLDEPVYAEHEYAVHEVTRTALARVQASARSEGGQWVLRHEGLEGRASTADKTHKAEPRFGVKADPLEFPVKDDELGAAALEDAARRLAERVGAQCQAAQKEALARARQAAAESPLEAVEDFALFVILVDEAPPVDLVAHLKKVRDFDDLEALGGKPRAKKTGQKPAAPPPPSEPEGLTLD